MASGELQLTTSLWLLSSWFPRRLSPSSLVSRASRAQMLLLNVPSEEAGKGKSHGFPKLLGKILDTVKASKSQLDKYTKGAGAP